MKSTRFWVILVALVLAFSALGSYFVLRTAQGGSIAYIRSGGKLVKQIDLSKPGEGYSFTLEGPNGGVNTISVERGRISVSGADCPDQVCVHQGWIENSLVPIVCLPNELVISLEDGAGGDIDGVSG